MFVIVLACFCTLLYSYAQKPNEIAFISDTQAPLWVESLFLKTNNNKEATNLLFKDIEASKPKALFILGDITGMSSYSKLWEPIDYHLNILKKNSIPYYAIPGNHEYMFFASYGINKFNQRFPNCTNYPYFKVIDSIAVIMLNSNFSKMKKEEKMNMYNKYIKLCDSLDYAPGIKKIIIACHHSPITNSKTVKPTGEVASTFVNKFLSLNKTALFISGHSHNIELFKRLDKRGTKYLLVAGGGGGALQPRYTGKDTVETDFIDSLGYRPEFFYITVSRNYNELIVNIHGLSQDFKRMEVKPIYFIK